LGEKFKQGRYVVLKKLGWGHFSTVWLVLDTHTHTFAALKVSAGRVDLAAEPLQLRSMDSLLHTRAHHAVLLAVCLSPHVERPSCSILTYQLAALQSTTTRYPLKFCPVCTMQVQKSASHYTEAARDEITLLSQISEGDPDSKKHCCRLLDSFEHSGPHGLHVCMVFEVLGDNLLSLIKAFDYKGVPLPVVRTLTRQMLVGLDYLHRCVVSRIVVQAERTQHRHVHSLVTCSTCGSYSCPAQEWRSWRVPKQLCSCAQLSRILVALVNALQGKLGLKCPASGQVLSMRLSH
jgi:serine/threonine protein kinase